MRLIKYIVKSNVLNSHLDYIYICPVFSKEMLFDNLSKNLKFPDYFGYNWDSLEELFFDFNWIEEPNIQIYHESICNLSKRDLCIYLSIIVNSVSCCQDDKQRRIEFIFNEEEKKKIEEVIQEITTISRIDQGTVL